MYFTLGKNFDEIEDLVYSSKIKPDNITADDWHWAIENELYCNEFLYDKYNESEEAETMYQWQKELMITAIKAMAFDSLPQTFIDKHGRIYLIFGHKDYFYISGCMENGALGFSGQGEVIILTLKYKNTLNVCLYNINSRQGIVKYIQKNKLDKALRCGQRLPLPGFNDGLPKDDSQNFS